MNSNSARLTSGLIVKKGQANPVTEEQSQAQSIPLPKKNEVLKAVTLKLNLSRYERLKLSAFKTGKTGQDILTQALDLWLEKNSF